DEEERYSISGDYFLPPTNLDADEALALIALAAGLGADDRVPFFGPARRAAQKLERSLPPGERQRLQRVARAIHFRIDAVGRLEGQKAVFQQLVEAIAAQRVVKIIYDSLTEWELTPTKLRPYRLLFNRHSWYVIGRSTLHADVRIFNLARISHIELLGQHYKM